MNPNVEKLRYAYKAWHDSRGASVPVWLDLVADDVVLRSVADGAPGMEFSAPRRGRAELQHYFAGLARDWEMIHYTADEFFTFDAAHGAVRNIYGHRLLRTTGNFFRSLHQSLSQAAGGLSAC